jgi:predicted enzyme related to lactoylglutathione lyase
VTAPELFRAVVPVSDIEAAVAYYERVMDCAGEWVGAGRVYFHGPGAILVCWDAAREGDGTYPGPNHGHLYFAVDDLDACFERARAAGGAWLEGGPALRAWGERSFYARDPSGNRICFVDASTRYLGAPESERATAEKSSERMPGIADRESAASRRDVRPEEAP